MGKQKHNVQKPTPQNRDIFGSLHSNLAPFSSKGPDYIDRFSLLIVCSCTEEV